MVVVTVSAGMAFLSFNQIRPTQWAVRWTACLVLGGLAAYNYAAFGLPGSQYWIEENGFAAIFLMLLVGMGVGLLVAWIWERKSSRS